MLKAGIFITGLSGSISLMANDTCFCPSLKNLRDGLVKVESYKYNNAKATCFRPHTYTPAWAYRFIDKTKNRPFYPNLVGGFYVKPIKAQKFLGAVWKKSKICPTGNISCLYQTDKGRIIVTLDGLAAEAAVASYNENYPIQVHGRAWENHGTKKHIFVCHEGNPKQCEFLIMFNK